jgi:small subunit ribosomal protein S6e
MLVGKKIGEVLEGSLVGLGGYKLKITGLSDKMGSPSRKEVEGSRKAYALLGSGAGIRHAKKGMRVRRLVRGNTISLDTEQINTIIEAYGEKPVEELFPKKEKPAEEKKAE